MLILVYIHNDNIKSYVYACVHVLTLFDSSNDTALEVASKLSIVLDTFCGNQTSTITIVEFNILN